VLGATGDGAVPIFVPPAFGAGTLALAIGATGTGARESAGSGVAALSLGAAGAGQAPHLVPGPYRVAAARVYSAGVAAGTVHAAGPVTAQVHSAGVEAGLIA
jgi:hypothetical protein